MTHFAQIMPDGTVIRVLVVDQDFINTGALGDINSWVETSYGTLGGVYHDHDTNTPSADQSKAFRKNFAFIGCTYDAARDAFIPPKPAETDKGEFILDEDTCLWVFVEKPAA